MHVTRRGMLIGTLAGGGLALGYLLRPRTFPLPIPPGKDEVAFDAWIKLSRGGMLTVAVPQLEMGQGITTLIPQIVATELGADWRQVAVEPAPVSAHYVNLALSARWADLWMPALAAVADEPEAFINRRHAENIRFMATADGMSLAAYEAPARQAAAALRVLLCMAAAERWSVSWRECKAQGGFVTHGKHRASFGELAVEASGLEPPEAPPLRAKPAGESPARFPVGAKLDHPRLDLPSKVDGSHLFAADVRLPGMLFASIRHGPIGDSTLAQFDPKKAAGTPGFRRVVTTQNWIAAVGETWWAAEQALQAIVPTFSVSKRLESPGIDSALEKALRMGDATRLYQSGDPETYLKSDFSLASRYGVAPAVHAGVETASATARFQNGLLELWIGSQAPEAALRAVAQALDLSERDVVLYPMASGGSFDRRLENDHAIEAALIARETGQPVQLTWPRWQEHVAGWPRTPVSAVMAARTTQTGEVVGWKARLAMPAAAREFGHRLFGGLTEHAAMRAVAGDFDAMAMEGTVPPYAIEHMAIEHVPATTGLPSGRMRGNAHGYTAFFNECFMDELAHRAGREPLSYRMAMLGGDPRLAACLQRVSSLAVWNGGNDSSGQGLACHVIGEGRIAAIATARRDENGIRVDRISAVADIGRIVNVDIARQQIEGGLVFGIGLALGCAMEYVDGLPVHGRLALLNLPRLADCPEVQVEFIESNGDTADPGELGVAIAAPAIANALFSATGLRFRQLPLLSEEV